MKTRCPALLLVCLLLAPALAAGEEAAAPAPAPAESPAGEKADAEPWWRPYADACMLCNVCRALRACEALGDKGELTALCRRYAEAQAPACRAQLEACRRDGRLDWEREDMAAMLAESEAILRGEEPVAAPTPTLHCGDLYECLPCDAAGEPWLTVPKAQARLRVASDTLFTALAELECHRGGRGWAWLRHVLAGLLPLYADYRREMQLWGARTLSEERLLRWEQEDLRHMDTESLPYGSAADWLDYLRADAEEAEAQYRLLQRRACRRAAGLIRHRLGKAEGVALPAERAWLLGEPAPKVASTQEAFFYRLRDAIAFCDLAKPLAGQGEAWRTLAELAQKGEYAVLGEKLGALRETTPGADFYTHLSWGFSWNESEEDFYAALWPRAGLSAARLGAPVRSEDEGKARVESSAACMASLLAEAQAALPSLPEGLPDAACRRLLVRLAAQWNAYAYTLKRWGRTDRHRSFNWYGGCMGFMSTEIWGEAYFLPGIHLYTVVDDKIVYVDRGKARALLAALIAEMKEQFEGSLQEHREHVEPTPPAPWEAEDAPSPWGLPNLPV